MSIVRQGTKENSLTVFNPLDRLPKARVRCVNAHDRCAGSHPCPWCEPHIPLRDDATGRFIAARGAKSDG